MRRLGLILAFLFSFISLAQAQIYLCCGMSGKLNITTSTVVKPAPGRLIVVNVTTAGSGAGAVYDSTTVGGIAASNLIFSVPNTAGVYYVPFPFLNGLTVIPGTGQVLSVSFQ